ncbi:MAG: hypothetical protein C0613_13570 [Desulfobulbaceae bacterium]|nr:MAG: hypothetical protein C0613_13570 [Desulfobulbaceae bacterium]
MAGLLLSFFQKGRGFRIKIQEAKYKKQGAKGKKQGGWDVEPVERQAGSRHQICAHKNTAALATVPPRA